MQVHGLAHIRSICHQLGKDDLQVDFVELKDGHYLAITADLVLLYQDVEDLIHHTHDDHRPSLWLRPPL